MDEYLKRNKIKRIDFIKLDVDGYEYKVIRGGINAIKKFKPVMVVEFGKENLETYGDSLEELIALLSSLGYLFYSERNLNQYPNRESILKAIIKNQGTINVLCVPR